VWADRYHARPLKTPREVRNALVYVIFNRKKHGGRGNIDPCSSAPYFEGWAGESRASGAPPVEGGAPDGWPVARAGTWLMMSGWKRLGLLHQCESPQPRSRL
jgi:hypothetical protein